MAGLARIVVPDVQHHVTQRGNRRQEVFFGEEGYAAYLTLIVESCAREGVRCLAVDARRQTGRPWGDAAFVKRLEELTSRVPTRRKPGPKPHGIKYRVPGINDLQHHLDRHLCRLRLEDGQIPGDNPGQLPI